MTYLPIGLNKSRKMLEPQLIRDTNWAFGAGSPLLLLLLAACGGGGNSGSSLESGPSSVLAVAGPFYISNPSVTYQSNSQITATDNSDVF